MMVLPRWSFLLFGVVAAGAQDPQLVTDGYLAGAQDARIYYRVIGDRPDTIVAIHGGPGAGMNAILPDFEPLWESHTVIFYDQRGGGRSELPADTTSLDARLFVEDLETVRRHFHLRQMRIVAHSFGGILVARYLQTHPDRVERLVFAGATGPRHSDAAALIMSKYVQLDSTHMSQLGEILGSLMSSTAADPVALCRDYEMFVDEMAWANGEPNHWQGESCSAPPEAVSYYYHYTARIAPSSFGDWDFTETLASLTTPLLVIHGDIDSLAVLQQQAWANVLPNGRLFLVPDAGKGALADRPDLAFPAIETFLQGEWPAGAR